MSGDVSSWVPVVTALAGMGGALGSQWLTHLFTVKREKAAAKLKLASERVFIGSQLIIMLASYREICHAYSKSPVKDEHIRSRPDVPNFSVVKGDWTVLSGLLQLRIHRLAFTRRLNEAELSEVFEHLGPDEFDDSASHLYKEVVSECDRIIEELRTLCDLPSPWALDE
ncbi:hypothetical protein [Pantoea stewartii]|uniref:hypothetical protein n=1 Tax=Pantoea stewartii TaxID=66269 RepID=UPI00067D711E|nr:hypothetical protein [Pantoea stewartii]